MLMLLYAKKNKPKTKNKKNNNKTEKLKINSAMQH